MKNNLVNGSFPFWDLFCALSIVGIWPRYIEPRMIFTTHLSLKIHDLPRALQGFKILQISDLHLNPQVSQTYLDKLIKKIHDLKPDLIAFTGDFLCYSQLSDPERLCSFLQKMHAPYGCYAVLGNHDYADCVSINSKGEYDVIDFNLSSLAKAFRRIGETISLKRITTERAKQIPMHAQLIALLKNTPFKLLHNETIVLQIKDAKLNICGLGEYMLDRLNTSESFRNYDEKFPGIILLHNPDGAPLLKNSPGNIILCGHTHGGQVNLPWIWKKFTLLENMEFKQGLAKVFGKWVYINRGIGSVLPFRWFSPPEILLLNLERL